MEDERWYCMVNPLPNNKILDITKLKALQMTNIPRMTSSHFDRVENTAGKGENAGRRKCWLPTFSPLPTVFSKALYLGVVKSWNCVVKS